LWGGGEAAIVHCERHVQDNSRWNYPAPYGCGPMILYAQIAIFSPFFLLRSRLFLSIVLIEKWQKHAENDFYFNLQHFHDFLSPHVAKVHAPLGQILEPPLV